jgi:hypothetical protein
MPGQNGELRKAGKEGERVFFRSCFPEFHIQILLRIIHVSCGTLYWNGLVNTVAASSRMDLGEFIFG